MEAINHIRSHPSQTVRQTTQHNRCPTLRSHRAFDPDAFIFRQAVDTLGHVGKKQGNYRKIQEQRVILALVDRSSRFLPDENTLGGAYPSILQKSQSSAVKTKKSGTHPIRRARTAQQPCPGSEDRDLCFLFCVFYLMGPLIWIAFHGLVRAAMSAGRTKPANKTLTNYRKLVMGTAESIAWRSEDRIDDCDPANQRLRRT